MFFKKSENQKEIARLEALIEGLKSERNKLKEEVIDLRLEKKTSEEDIKHMVKMKEEKLEVVFERKTLQLEKEYEQKINKVKDEYRDKVEKHLEKGSDDLKDMYNQIVQMLPNVNVKMNGKI